MYIIFGYPILIVIHALLISSMDLEKEAQKAPNFLIILVDDLGYGDLGCYGNQIIKTPNLDLLAAQGMRLTDCYASSPMCSPSRAGLLTGRVPYRTGVYDWISPDSSMHLPAEEITIASLLKKSGYSTAHIGKWHLNGKFNSPEHPQPDDHGFDYWFGVQYSQPHLNPEGFVRNGVPVETKGYASDIVADEAIHWLKQGEPNKPFFQFVCFLEPHEPIMSPHELVDEYAEYGIKAEYYANVTKLDQAIGRIMAALDEMSLTENTLVFFTSDNGPAEYTPNGYFNKSHGSAGPLKGYKRHMFEGGIRIPGIIRWPGHVKPGQLIDEPISNVDVLPTFCQLAGINAPSDRVIDGSDITPIFSGQKLARATPLHWHFYDPWGGPQSVLREGDWVLGAHWDVGDFHEKGRFDPKEVQIIKNSQLSTFELYNIKDDLHQDRNVVMENGDQLNVMKQQLIRLHKRVMQEANYHQSDSYESN